MPQKKIGNYIGVTGVVSTNEIYAGISMIPDGAKHRFMPGVLMSSKTLAGETNKYPSRYPKKEAIGNIFVRDSRVLNLIHYSTDNRLKLCTEIRQIVELAGPYLDGFQFNIKWPPPSQMEMIREMFPDLYLVLQIGRGAMEEIMSMEHLEAALGSYIHFVDGILVDGSGGNNVALDPVKVAEYLRVARNYPFDLVVAGGLSSHTLHLLESIIQEFGKKVSIDAEGGVRTLWPEDILLIGEMRRYLRGSYELLE